MKADDQDDPIAVRPLRPGRNSRGSKTVAMILQAAVDVLIEEGSAAFTLRRIAQECGLRLSNVTRHFPRKEMLLQELLQEIIVSSEIAIDHHLDPAKMSAEDALAIIITGTMDDINTKRTTHLMSEFWAMSNHDNFVANCLEGLYQFHHKVIGSFVKQLNPALNADQVEAVALIINAMTEGSTVLAGHGKPWEAKLPLMKAIAAKSLIHMVKTITPDDIQKLQPSRGSMAGRF